MATFDSIKTKIQNLINTANAATAKTDADLTIAVDSLVDGYGQGGGIEEATEMPAATSENEGKIIKYTGTSGEYESGVLYICEKGETIDEEPAIATLSLEPDVVENDGYRHYASTTQLSISGGVEDDYVVAVSEELDGVVEATLEGNQLKLRALDLSEGEYSGTVTVSSGAQSIDVPVTYSIASCLTGDMLITLADGSQKRIDELTFADRVLAIDPATGGLIADKIYSLDNDNPKTHSHYDKYVLSDGTILKIVHRHRFFNIENQRMQHIDTFNIGDRFYKQDGSAVTLVEAIPHYEDVETYHYTLFTLHQNYFVNGILSGNRFTKQIRLEV